MEIYSLVGMVATLCVAGAVLAHAISAGVRKDILMLLNSRRWPHIDSIKAQDESRQEQAVSRMEDQIQEMVNHTDLWPWYWIAYGEKCYAFAVVEAYQKNEGNPMPKPGSQLEMNEDGNWCGENGIEMIIEGEIANIESQNGDSICSFIAGAHAHFLKEHLAT